MRLFRFLRKAENETDRKLEKESIERRKSVGAFLTRELIDGEMYEFGEPWQLTSESLSAVVPILRRFDQDREYLVIQEIPKGKITVTDSGRINQVNVALKGVEKPIFVRVGTIFQGLGTQSRASGMSMVLELGKKNLVEVFCVHATHGISSLSSFAVMSTPAPRRVEDALVSRSANQTMVWRAAAVRGHRARISRCPKCGSSSLLQTYESELVCMQCGYPIPSVQRNLSNRQINSMVRPRVRVGAPRSYSPSATLRDNLIANLKEAKEFNKQIEGMLSKIPADLENQVGVVIIDSKGVLGLEMFDHPNSWRAFSRSVVRNYADVLARERAGEGLFALRTERIPEAIRKFLEKAEGLSETPIFKNRISETGMFSGELAGEYTTMKSDVIHLMLKRKAVA